MNSPISSTMTVENCFARETESYVHKNAKFYPERIPIAHWQLRHYISNPEPDLLYYGSSRDIFCLNTATDTRTHITVIPFCIRCTAAGYGYICVGGGDTGSFAIVTLNDTSRLADSNLPGWQRSMPPIVQVEMAGADILNSISIHKLEGCKENGSIDDVVAVLTNNDRTIRIFSLTQHAQNTVLELSFPVNHATISPDGKTLVAVGDLQQAYFYDRVDLRPTADSKSPKYASAHCMWELVNIVTLHVPRPRVQSTGYFTTAWNASSSLCALASECGYISIIDMQILQDADDGVDAIVAVVTSTRPENVDPRGPIPGAIRSMLFAPNPWDLLVWAEDQGRVCVADLRLGLQVRHVLKLEPDNENYQRIEMNIDSADGHSSRVDVEMEQEYVRQFQPRRMLDDDTLSHSEDVFAIAEARRTLERSQRWAREALHLSAGLPLSSREQELLDSLRMTRQSSPTPPSYDYRHLELINSNERARRRQQTMFQQDFPALARQIVDASDLHNHRAINEYIRQRESESAVMRIPSRTTTSARDLIAFPQDGPAEQPPTLAQRATQLAQDANQLQDAARRLLSTTRSAPSQRESSTSSSTANDPSSTNPEPHGTQTSEFEFHRRRLQRQRRANANMPLPSNPLALPTTTQDTSTAYRLDPPTRYNRFSALTTRGDFYDPALGLRTAGLAISGDGRRLWCACDKGIFEFELNLSQRRGMDAVSVK